MNRIHQMYPRRPFTQLERWWGFTKNKEVQAATSVGKNPKGLLYVAHRKKTSMDLGTNASILLESSSTQCLGSYICQVLKAIYILHWIPFFRRYR